MQTEINKKNLVTEIKTKIEEIDKENYALKIRKFLNRINIYWIIILSIFWIYIYNNSNILFSEWNNTLIKIIYSIDWLFLFSWLIFGLIYLTIWFLFRIKNKDNIKNYIFIYLKLKKDNLNSLTINKLLEIKFFLDKYNFYTELKEKNNFLHKHTNFNNDNINESIKKDFEDYIQNLLTDREKSTFDNEKFNNFDGLDSLLLVIYSQYNYLKQNVNLNLDIKKRIDYNKKLIKKYRWNNLLKPNIEEIIKENNELKSN